jgi:Arc/MetJ-type ribon-helix-helix transcriptional regulator
VIHASPRHLEERIGRLVASGRSTNASETVQVGLRLLNGKERALPEAIPS